MKKIISYFLLLTAVVVAGTACKKDKKDTPPVVPTINVVSVIKGKVQNVSNLAQSGVAVSCKLNNVQVATTTTNNLGVYLFDAIAEAGNYVLTFSKDGLTPMSISVVVNKTDKMGSFVNHNVVLMPVGINKQVTTDANGLSQAETEIVVPQDNSPVLTTATTVTVPAQTVIKDAADKTVANPTIVITPTNDITSATNTSAPIAVLQCTPSGLKFSNPITISFPNPVGAAYEMKNISLYYFNEQTGVWDKESGVDFAGDTYTASVNHFSSYKIGIDGSITSSSVVKEPFTINSIDNLNGSNAISITSVKVINNAGYIYDANSTPEAAVTAAGISGADKQPIIDLITNSVKSMNGGFDAVESFATTANSDYPMVVTVNPGVRVDFTANNEYRVETINFVFGNKTITVKTKKALNTSVSYNAYNRNHTGGSGGSN